MKLQHKVNTICFHNGNSKIWTKALQASLWKPILWISRLWRNNPIALNLSSYPGATGATDYNPPANFPRLNCCRRNWFSLPLASVPWLVQCTLECHWNNSVHEDATGRPSDHFQGTLEHHWRNVVETAPNWDATGETLAIAAYTGTSLEVL